MTSPIPLSFIAEYEYCPRSCYWKLSGEAPRGNEYHFIADGNAAHEIVDAGYKHSKSMKKVESSVRVFSEEFHISGKTDILEFHQDGEIIPVELKRGKVRQNSMHEIQLALMALCLHEMFPENKVDRGAIFFTNDRHKEEILLRSELLEKAKNLAKTVFEKTKQGLDPLDFPRFKDERCQGCCFYDLCYLD
jgi:CRISPR-associated exonuclease Cas4